MNQTKVRSSSLFLMELIISILFFAVAAAFCVQFIVRARGISQDARNLSSASVNCSSVAELINASDSLEDVLEGAKLVWGEAVECDEISAEASTSQTVSAAGETAQNSSAESGVDTKNADADLQDASAQLQICFDSNWEPCEAAEASYVIQADVTFADGMLEGYITSTGTTSNQLIYSLDVKHHVQKEAGK